MDALRELFTTPIGLLSLGTIAGAIVIVAFIARMLLKKVNESKPPAG